MTDGLWEKANDVGEIGYKLHNLSSVAALLAEALAYDINSGAAWALYDGLVRLSDDLDKKSTEIMQLQKASIEEPKKGKKK